MVNIKGALAKRYATSHEKLLDVSKNKYTTKMEARDSEQQARTYWGGTGVIPPVRDETSHHTTYSIDGMVGGSPLPSKICRFAGQKRLYNVLA